MTNMPGRCSLQMEQLKHTSTRIHIRFTHFMDKYILNILLLKWYGILRNFSGYQKLNTEIIKKWLITKNILWLY
jgi:hypothetical protein